MQVTLGHVRIYGTSMLSSVVVTACFVNKVNRSTLHCFCDLIGFVKQ